MHLVDRLLDWVIYVLCGLLVSVVVHGILSPSPVHIEDDGDVRVYLEHGGCVEVDPDDGEVTHCE